MLHICDNSLYGFDLHGTERKRVGLPDTGHHLNIHPVQSNGILCTPIHGLLRPPKSSALLFDAAKCELVSQSQKLGGDVILSSAKSYIMLQNDLIQFFWRTPEEEVISPIGMKPYFIICFGVALAESNILESNAPDNLTFLKKNHQY